MQIDIAKQIATDVVAKIKENTKRGFDRGNQRFRPYSTERLVIPYSRIMFKGKLKPPAEIFREGKQRFVIFSGGYKQYREMMGLQVRHVDLSLNGFMLSAFSIRDAKAVIEKVIIDLSQYGNRKRGVGRGFTGTLELGYVMKELEMDIGYYEDKNKKAYDLATANIKLGRRFVGIPKKQLQQIIYDTCRENDILPHPIFKGLRFK